MRTEFTKNISTTQIMMFLSMIWLNMVDIQRLEKKLNAQQ